jgi:hypothetical protein
MKTLIIAAILLLACNAAQAATGNEYLQLEERAQAFLIIGIVDGMSLASYFSSTNLPWCYPNKSTYAQDMLILKKYLDNHPQDLHYEIESLLFNALTEGFPCSPSKKTSKHETKF